MRPADDQRCGANVTGLGASMSSNTLKYKGQIGSIEHDLDRGMLYGKLLFINDLVLMGNKVAEHLKISTEKGRKLVISTINQ
ncbi:hypothetical protein GCM10008110_14410 [Marinobacter persicus]|nr:hypothetical protein GCM10008110_14410 [Marinobacter persicus]